MIKIRKNSFAFCGGAFGDEGKGRIVDEYVSTYLKKGKVIVYRDNGGANAGHTVSLPNDKKAALHLLPSGIFCPKAILILGKEMVIHPGDLIAEIDELTKNFHSKNLAKIIIDEMAILSLDTHRAFESTLKNWEEESKASTGRGISPAYADVLLRHPLRMRDLKNFNLEKIKKHYQLYQAFNKGFEYEMSKIKVPTIDRNTIEVGNEEEFINRLKKQAKKLEKYIENVNDFLKKEWNNKKTTFVFEKAQAVGLDHRFGVYPDITASNTTFSGILSSTEGIINPKYIEIKAGVIKATYMSSVGTRILPTKMEDTLANQIREDANEYGNTTRRPRGIAYLDLPALNFYTKAGDINCHVLTHLDIVYPKTPIKICVAYTLNGKKVDYRPDQEFLLKVKPVYKNFASWDSEKLKQAKKYTDLPANAKKFLKFVENHLETKIIAVTTGPKRNQTIWF
jgi:adenylosuccinate synthase